MYQGMPYSPETHLGENITADATTIIIADSTVLPDAPNWAVLTDNITAETIEYTRKSGNQLSGIKRGVQEGGKGANWAAGTIVARYMVELGQRNMASNITDAYEKVVAAQNLIDLNAEEIKNAFDSIAETNDSVKAHIEDSDNPHKTTKAQVGLSYVDNTSDKDKPVSWRTQEVIDDVYGNIVNIRAYICAQAIVTAISPESMDWAIRTADQYRVLGRVLDDAGNIGSKDLRELDTLAEITANATAVSAVIASKIAMTAMAVNESAVGAIFANGVTASSVISSDTAMAAIAASKNAMEMMLANETITASVIANETAMTAIASSKIAMTAVLESVTARASIITSRIAMRAITTSRIAMVAVAANQNMMAAILMSDYAFDAVIMSDTAMVAIAADENAMRAILANEIAMTAVIESETAMTAIAADENAMTEMVADRDAFNAIRMNAAARAAVTSSLAALNAISSSPRRLTINTSAMTATFQNIATNVAFIVSFRSTTWNGTTIYRMNRTFFEAGTGEVEWNQSMGMLMTADVNRFTC